MNFGFNEKKLAGGISVAEFMRCRENLQELKEINHNDEKMNRLFKIFMKILRAVLWIVFLSVWGVGLLAGGEVTLVCIVVGIVAAFISLF